MLFRSQHGMQHAVYGAEGSIVAFVEAAQTMEVAEQLVRAVNEMNNHDISWPAALDRQCKRRAAAWRFAPAELFRQHSAGAAHLLGEILHLGQAVFDA